MLKYNSAIFCKSYQALDHNSKKRKYNSTVFDNETDRNRLFIEHEFNSADSNFDRCHAYAAEVFVGEKPVIISLGILTVLRLHKHVATLMKTIHYCRGLATAPCNIPFANDLLVYLKTCHMFTPLPHQLIFKYHRCCICNCNHIGSEIFFSIVGD